MEISTLASLRRGGIISSKRKSKIQRKNITKLNRIRPTLIEKTLLPSQQLTVKKVTFDSSSLKYDLGNLFEDPPVSEMPYLPYEGFKPGKGWRSISNDIFSPIGKIVRTMKKYKQLEINNLYNR